MPTPRPALRTNSPRPARSAAGLASGSRHPKPPCLNGGAPPRLARGPSSPRSGAARPVGSSFSPLDQKLRLGTEGYSPAVLRKAVRQAGKASSFQDASDDLKELAQVVISPQHLGKVAERIGRAWATARDADVQAFREKRL